MRDDRVPQMAGAEEVVAGIERRDGHRVLRPRAERARLRAVRGDRLDRVNVTLAATEEFNRRNGNASLDEAVARVEQILAAAQVPATVTISVAFGCPFEGRVDPAAWPSSPGASRARRSSSPTRSASRRRARSARSSSARGAAGFHGHNTRNTGYANALAASRRAPPCSTRRSAGSAAARTRRARAATSRPRISSTCSSTKGVETGRRPRRADRISTWLEGSSAGSSRASSTGRAPGRPEPRGTPRPRGRSPRRRSASSRPRRGSPCGRPSSCRSSRPGRASCTRASDLVRALVRLEAEEHLVEHDLVQQLDAVELDDPLGEARGARRSSARRARRARGGRASAAPRRPRTRARGARTPAPSRPGRAPAARPRPGSGTRRASSSPRGGTPGGGRGRSRSRRGR